MGVEVVAIGFDSVAENHEWVLDEGFQFEVWSDSNKELGLYYGAATSASQSAPSRITRILDAQGNVAVIYDDVNFVTNPRDVLDDCQVLFGP